MSSLIYNIFIISYLLYGVIIFNKNFFKIDNFTFLNFFIYHITISFIYFSLFKNNPADYKTYMGLAEYENFSVYSLFSANLINSIIFFLKKKIYFNDFSIIIFFLLISFFGILLFIKNLQIIGVKKEISYLFFYLPGIHLWTVAPGKDGLILLLTSTFIYMYFKNRFSISLFFILLVFLIRPHIGLIFFIAILITEFLNNNGIKKIYIILGLFLIFLLIPNLPVVKNIFFNYRILSDNIFIQMLGQLNNMSLKFINTSTAYEPSNLIINIINYFIFPISYLTQNKSFLINISIMVESFSFLLILIFVKLNKNQIILQKKIIYFLTIVIVLYLITLPQTIFNYGLNLRQKWMILPILIYFFFFLKTKYLKINKK